MRAAGVAAWPRITLVLTPIGVKGGAATMRRHLHGLKTTFFNHPIRSCTLGLLGLFAILTTCLLFFHSPLPLSHQPFPDAHEYLDAANRLAHGQGYTTTVRDNVYSHHIHEAVNPPRFPPGTSLVLAPFALLGHFPGNIEFGSRLLVVGLVLATGWAAFTLAGWYAALLAVLIASTTDFLLIQTQIVMSDVLAALLAVLCIPLLRSRRSWALYLLGFIAGYGVLVRQAGFVVVLAVLLVLGGRDRLRAATAASLPIVGLFLYSWSTFGAPWRTGYGYWLGSFPEFSFTYIWKHPWSPGGEDGYFASSLNTILHLLSYGSSGAFGVLPNALFYPLVILGFSTVFGPPLLGLLGSAAAVWKWRLPEARFALLVAVLTVVVYMANFTQDARFMAGPSFLLMAWGSAALVVMARRLRDRYGDQIVQRIAGAPASTAHARSRDLPSQAVQNATGDDVLRL